MTFLDIAKTRCSVRSYTNQTVAKEHLEKILEAAHVAPTAANLQPVHLLVVQGAALAKVEQAANIYGAPLAIIICGDHSKSWTRPFDGKETTDIDATILTDHMMLEATELGLGSVWICYFKPDIIKREFNLPNHLEPINILAIGHTDSVPAPPDRHKTERIPLNQLAEFINE